MIIKSDVIETKKELFYCGRDIYFFYSIVGDISGNCAIVGEETYI